MNVSRPVFHTADAPASKAGWRPGFAAAVTVLLLFCSGCGVSRLPVSGSVSVAGEPLKYGTILFKTAGATATETHQIVLEVRDGKFITPTGLGVPAGKYDITINVFEGEAPPPAQAATDGSEGSGSAVEPKVVGKWAGPAEVESGKELTFAIEKGSLQAPNARNDSA